MFGNNKQETLNRINALTNEYQQLQISLDKDQDKSLASGNSWN